MDSKRKLITSHGFMWFGREIFKIFISIYLWKLTNDLSIIAIFYILYSLSHVAAFYLFGNTVKKGNIRLPITIGLSGMVGLIAIFFILKENCVNYIIPLGISFGFFNGLYWISYHVFRFDLTTSKNRGKYVSYERAVRIFGSIVAPVLGGWLILQNFFELDYGLIFIIGCISYLFALFFTNIKYNIKHKSSLKLKKCFKKVMKIKDIRDLLIAQFFAFLGRGGGLTILIPLFLFESLKSEFHVGELLTLFAIIGMISSFAMGKFLNYKYYKKVFQVSITLFILSLFMLAGFPALITYIIFGFFRDALQPFIAVPKITYNFNILNKKLKDYKKMRVEYVIFRETAGFLFGNTLSYSLLFFVPSLTSVGMMTVLFIMGVAIFLEFYFFSKVKTKLENIK